MKLKHFIYLLLLFVAIGILVYFLKAQESKKDLNKGLKNVEITIDWVPTGEYYGFFYALEKGLYKELGYEVKIISGTGAPSVANQIASNSIIFGTTTSENIVYQILRGASFYKAVPLVKYNPASIISLGSDPIRNLNELKSKILGVNPQSTVYSQFEYCLNLSGIKKGDFKEYPIGYGGPIELESGRVDAFLGYTTNHAIDLKLKHIKINEILLGDIGIKSFGLVFLVGQEEHFTEKGFKKVDIENIINATIKGYELGARDISASVSALRKSQPLLDSLKLKEVIGKMDSLNKVSSFPLEDIDKWIQNDSLISIAFVKSKKLYVH